MKTPAKKSGKVVTVRSTEVIKIIAPVLPASVGEKYVISLPIGTFTIPLMGNMFLDTGRITMDEADACFAAGCDWIKLR